MQDIPAYMSGVNDAGVVTGGMPNNPPVAHNMEFLPGVLSHRIAILPDTLLSRFIGGAENHGDVLMVNSFHHQACDSLGKGVLVSAKSYDGVVEAIEVENRGFCLGVQWHPEILDGACSDGIFGGFFKACLKYKESRWL